MSQDRRFSLLAALTFSFALAACGGGKGSSASPPSDFKVQGTDQAVAMTWTADPNVDYWVFIGPPGTTPDNFASTAGAYAIPHVTSPFTLSSLTFNGLSSALVNGRTYVATINARTGGGPGGASSTPQTVVPAAAGVTWNAGATLVNSIDNTADALLAGAFGLPIYNSNGTLLATGAPAAFVLTGHNGAAFYSTQAADGLHYNYTATTSGVASGTDLTAVGYGQGLGYLAIGTGGQSSLSLDGQTWTPQVTGTTRNFRALFATSTAGFIAVGDNCAVYAVGTGGTNQTTAWTDYSTGFTASSAFSSGCASTTAPISLRSVTSGAGVVVAVGTQGTLAYSLGYGSTTNGVWAQATVSWPTGVNPATVNLRSVLYGVAYETQSDGTNVGVPLWEAVGDYTDGTGVHPLILFNNSDPSTTNGVTSWTGWTAATLPSGLGNVSLSSVAAATDPVTGALTMLVASGDNGVLLRDLLWVPKTTNNVINGFGATPPLQAWELYGYPAGSAVTARLNAVVHGHFGFQALGDGGTRLYTY